MIQLGVPCDIIGAEEMEKNFMKTKEEILFEERNKRIRKEVCEDTENNSCLPRKEKLTEETYQIKKEENREKLEMILDMLS